MSRDSWAPNYNRCTLIFHHSKLSYYPGATLLWISTTSSSASYTKQPKFSPSTWFIFNAAIMKDIENIPWTPGMTKSAPSLGGRKEYFLTILFFLWLVCVLVNKSNWGGSRNHLTMSPDRMSLFTKQGRSIGLIMFSLWAQPHQISYPFGLLATDLWQFTMNMNSFALPSADCHITISRKHSLRITIVASFASRVLHGFIVNAVDMYVINWWLILCL